MADNKREVTSIGNLTVKVDVDLGDTIAQLKSVQREAREATKALRVYETEAEPTKYLPIRAGEFIEGMSNIYLRPKEGEELRVTTEGNPAVIMNKDGLHIEGLDAIPTDVLKRELRKRGVRD